jgi:hypothetical protein
MIWLALGVYAVVGVLFVLALCLAASRSDELLDRTKRHVHKRPSVTEAEHQPKYGT